MKVMIARHYWDRIGGAVLTGVITAKTFIKRGYDVSIVSTFNFNEKKFIDWFGEELKIRKKYFLIPQRRRHFELYQWTLFPLILKRAVIKENPDILIIDNALYRNVLKFRKLRIIEYVHYPFEIMSTEIEKLPRKLRRVFFSYFRDAKRYYKKYDPLFLHEYFKLYTKIYPYISRPNPFSISSVNILANSQYISKLIYII